jgi:polar amino acid transport system substrate-binding protein
MLIRIFYLFFILFFILFSINVFAQPCHLSIRSYPYQPLAYKTPDNQWHGLNVAFINQLLPLLGCQLKYVEIPFARSIKMLKEGKVDVMLSVSKTPEREKTLAFIGPVRLETMLLVTNNTIHKKITSLADIINIKGKIGLRRGTYIGNAFEQLMNNDANFAKRIISISNTTQMIEMLNKKKIVGFFEEELHFHHQKRMNSDYKELNIQPLSVTTEPVYIAFSKKSVSKDLLAQLSIINQKLIVGGAYQQIINHYLAQLDEKY